MKAFVELVSASSVRTGAQCLMMVIYLTLLFFDDDDTRFQASGLGGMRPNTVVLGEYREDVLFVAFLHTPRFLWRQFACTIAASDDLEEKSSTDSMLQRRRR